MVYELLLDLGYIALACGLAWGVWQLRGQGYFADGFLGSLPADPLAGGIVLLMGVVFFFLVVYVGMTPPMIFHLLLGGAAPKHHAVKLADLFAIGPIGNLAQLIGAGTAAYLYVQATSLMFGASLVFGVLSVVYRW